MQFNYDERCNIVVKLYSNVGATEVAACEKKEGGFGRIFVITLDSGHCVAAKSPTKTAGPARLTTNSEVAAMEYYT